MEDHQFNYMMLSRLKMDCEYYLGNGGKSAKSLWALDEQEQINEMRRLWNLLPEKPEWLTSEQIDNYEKQMVNEKGN